MKLAVIARINGVLRLCEELYLEPKQKGVQRISIPSDMKKVLQEAYLKIREDNGETEFKKVLAPRFDRLNNEFDFMTRDNNENSASMLYLNKLMPSLNGEPFLTWQFFGWYGNVGPQILLEEKNIDEKLFTRSLPVIADSKGHILHGMTISQDFNNFGMDYTKKYGLNSADTVFSFHNFFSDVDGPHMAPQIFFKEGRIVGTDKFSENDIRRKGYENVVNTTLMHANIGHARVSYYVDNSNLSDVHRASIKELAEFVREFRVSDKDLISYLLYD